jgi:hypothetical protein
MPMALRTPGCPGTSTSPCPVLASAFQTAPVGIEPTYSEVPRPAAMPSGCQPSGRGMVPGKLARLVAPAVAGSRATTAMSSGTSRRRADSALEIIGPPGCGDANSPNLVEPATTGIRRR